jgi:hypothetical protein
MAQTRSRSIARRGFSSRTFELPKIKRQAQGCQKRAYQIGWPNFK